LEVKLNNTIEKEEELYVPIKNFFEEKGFLVKGEVADCDIYALKDNFVVIVELKKTLSIRLLTQAVQRQKITDIVYIAVPTPKYNLNSSKWKHIVELIKKLELGIIFVSKINKKYFANIVLEPDYFDKDKFISNYEIKRKKAFEEFKKRNFDLNVGGRKGKIITAYKELSIKIVLYIIKNGPVTVKNLSENGFEKKKLNSIFYKNYYGWFEKIKRGLYDVTLKGRQETLEFMNNNKV
jgi:hypothetical protein